jgi:hypothetical protein
MRHENLQFWAWQAVKLILLLHCNPHTPQKKTERKRDKKDKKEMKKSMLNSAHEHKMWTLVR